LTFQIKSQFYASYLWVLKRITSDSRLVLAISSQSHGFSSVEGALKTILENLMLNFYAFKACTIGYQDCVRIFEVTSEVQWIDLLNITEVNFKNFKTNFWHIELNRKNSDWTFVSWNEFTSKFKFFEILKSVLQNLWFIN